MKTKFFVAGIMACIGISAQAQDVKAEEPKGKAIVQVFGNFNTEFGTEPHQMGFELERSYLGYEYQLGDGLSVKGVMDIGRSSDISDYHRVAYIKNAMLSWKSGKFTLNGGLISTNQFGVQEKFWGYRYIMKSFQDLYKFGNSADLGLSVAYKFADWLSADMMVVNGEGYKKIQNNAGLNYGVGVSINPLDCLQFRFFGGLNEGGADGQSDQMNMAAFVGYKRDGFSIGAEYNKCQNASHKEGVERYGYSAYATVNLNKCTALFARFDDLCIAADGVATGEQAAIFGGEFKLGDYVKIAPNVRVNMPKAEGEKRGYSAFINCYFGF